MRQLILALAAIVAMPVAAQERPVYPCFSVEEAPVVDGAVADDAGWAGVPRVTGFYALGGGYTEAKQSVALACRDADRLYVAMVCEEPDIAEARWVMGDGDALWLEDGVEVFIEPARGGATYQFIVTGAGARRGAEAAASVEGWEAAAQRGEDGYSIELSIPLAGFAREPDADWRIAFCRNTFVTASGGDKFTCWPALRASFHEPESYASVDFRAEVASAELRAAAERALNADYRSHLIARVRALAPAGEEYLPTLRRAAEHDGHLLQGEARRAVLAWMRVGRAAGSAGDAEIAELRDAALLAGALRERSYQLAWRYQMEELLSAHGR